MNHRTCGLTRRIKKGTKQDGKIFTQRTHKGFEPIRDCDMSNMNYPNINRFQVTLSVLLIACRLFSRRQLAVGQDVHREARTSRVWRESQKGINRQISSTRGE